MFPTFTRATALLLLAAGAATAAAAETPLAVSAGDPALAWGACPPIFPAGCEIGVLHGDPARPNADVFLRVGAGQVLPAHTHTSAERMVLVAGRLSVKYQGAAETTLTPGMYAYGPAGLPHRATCAGDAPCVLFIAFEGPVDALAHSGPLN
jgi:mannose-6-phosphate isomerase-like protein (cupin superfamily)